MPTVCVRIPMSLEFNTTETATTATPIEARSAGETAITMPLEGGVLTIESLQAIFGWTPMEMSIIEPAIWEAAAKLPRDEAEIPDKAGRNALSKLDRSLDRVLSVLGQDATRWPLIAARYEGNLEAFYAAVEACRDLQQRARKTIEPQKRGSRSQNLRPSCEVLKKAWCATGRSYSHSDPDRPEAKSQAPEHVFIKWVISRLRPGRENELRTILREL